MRENAISSEFSLTLKSMEVERNEKDKHVEMEEKVVAGDQQLPWISQRIKQTCKD